MIMTSTKPLTVAIVGATGAVGQEMLSVLNRRNFPIGNLRCFASERSAGQLVSFQNKPISIEVLKEGCFYGVDIALFSAGKTVSLKFAPQAVREGALVVDNSSAFRMDPEVPLIIPEINPDAIKDHKGIIACPNCSTIIMLMVLGPLHRRFQIKRVVAATYQAASGAGAQAMRELELETQAVLAGNPFERTVIPHPYAFNLFTHNSAMTENGYVEEELKLLYETRKILDNPSIGVNATCVRVPVLRAHAEALNVTFEHPITVDTAYAALDKLPGIQILEDRTTNRFAMPLDASGQDDVFYGRIRKDLSLPNTLDFWVVGDQLLKGAALNAVQIAELLI